MDINSTQKSPAFDVVASAKKTAAAGNVADIATAKAQAAQSDQPVARDQVEQAAATIQEFVQSTRREINFSVDDGSGGVVVKVTDSTTGDVIRQIPSEEALQLAESLSDMRSLLFKAEA